MSVVAERQLDFFGADGVVAGVIRIEAPRPDRGASTCDWTVTWPGFESKRYTTGVDSYQAISLALLATVAEIASSDDFKGGRIGVFGEKICTRRELKEIFGIHRLPGFDP
jgi:hypothetical protein